MIDRGSERSHNHDRASEHYFPPEPEIQAVVDRDSSKFARLMP